MRSSGQPAQRADIVLQQAEFESLQKSTIFMA